MQTKKSLIQRLHQTSEGNQRTAVSPVIATLLLIAIAVAAGIVVYIFVSGLTSNLTAGGGGKQVLNSLSVTASDASSQKGIGVIYLFVQNTGPSQIVLDSTNGITASESSNGGTFTTYTATSTLASGEFCLVTSEGTGNTAPTCLTTLTISGGATTLIAILDTSKSPAGFVTSGNTFTLRALTVDGSSLPLGSVTIGQSS